MLLTHRIARCRHATSPSGAPPSARTWRFALTMLVMLALPLALPSRIHGQFTPTRSDAQPQVQDVIRAHEAARAWLSAFTLPDPDDPAARVEMTGAEGVCVTLRRSGEVLGTGVDAERDALALRRAMGRAMGAVLAHETVIALGGEARAFIGPLLTLELEVARGRRPLLGRSFAQLGDELVPGLDGIAARRGDRWAILFPSQMLARNAAGRISDQAPGLVTELGLRPRELEELRSKHDVSFYRFRTVHLAQVKPQAMPFIAFRGEQIVMSMHDEAVRELANEIAQHLTRSAWPSERGLGLHGTYVPVSDSYEPLVAAPRDQALAALALLRYARLHSADPAVASEAAGLAERILQVLAAPLEDDAQLADLAPVDDPLTAAFIILALEARQVGPPAQEGDALRTRAAKAIVALAHDELGFVAPGPSNAPSPAPAAVDEEAAPPAPLALPLHQQAVLAAALVELANQRDAGISAQRVRAVIDSIWSDAESEQRVALLPWMGWAELRLAEQTQQPMRHVDDLRLLADELQRVQIRPNQHEDARDLVGGFDLLRLARGDLRAPVADAQSMRPAAWLARAVREPALTPDGDRLARSESVWSALRFLRQLTVGKEDSWAVRNHPRAVGGVRAATWNSDQPVAAQAMALLFAAEAVESLPSMERMQIGD